MEFRIPVAAQIYPDRFHKIGTSHNKLTPQELMDMGLRAQLQMQSFITGQLSFKGKRPETNTTHLKLAHIRPPATANPTTIVRTCAKLRFPLRLQYERLLRHRCSLAQAIYVHQ